MSTQISAFSLHVHANTTSYCCLKPIKNCFDSITQFVLKVFRKIADFFYNLLHKQPHNPAETPVTKIVTQEAAPAEVNTVKLKTYNPPYIDPQTMISFYHGKDVGEYGLVLLDFLSEGDRRMSFEDFDLNDYWLWAFPTINLNPYIYIGPLLDPEDFSTFLKDPIVRENIVKVFKRVLAYFGLQLNDKHLVEKGPNFDERAKCWITYNNHNYNRLARILSSLIDMQNYGDLSPNLEGYARSLVNCLKTIFDENIESIGYRNYQLWWRLAFH